MHCNTPLPPITFGMPRYVVDLDAPVQNSVVDSLPPHDKSRIEYLTYHMADALGTKRLRENPQRVISTGPEMERDRQILDQNVYDEYDAQGHLVNP